VPSPSTKSKYAATDASTRLRLSVVDSSASRTLQHEVVGVLVEQRQVELELAREVLVEHGLLTPARSAMSSMAAEW
jgi:hypothetical protein